MPNCSYSYEGGCAGNGTAPGVALGPAEPVHQALGVVLNALLAVVVFSLGCSVQGARVWLHLRRPWGVAAGLLCQFGVMPLTAHLLALGLAVRPVQAVAILIMGSCPGGVISNIITYWLDGDMDLSITMTACSTVLGLGMMPLCLYIYSYSWVQAGSIKIPYENIGVTLVTLVVPVACGVFVNHKWPKAAKMILKVGSVFGASLILVIAIANAVLYKGSWNVDASFLIIGFIFPLIGYSFGFIISIIMRQPWPRCRTIALETGTQNVQIASTVLQVSFPPEQLAQMFTFPLIYASSQLLNGLLLVAARLQDRGQVVEDLKTTALNASHPGEPANWPLIKGFVSLGLCIVGFGSAFVPIKKADTGDGMFFQWVFCGTLWLGSFLVHALLGCPRFWLLSSAGGVLWCIGNLATVPILKTVGLGMGYLIWSTFTLLMGWATASAVFLMLIKTEAETEMGAEQDEREEREPLLQKEMQGTHCNQATPMEADGRLEPLEG
ncbi:ileal sodium/bile acid cotransporter-like [Megalops cyprinoides]|uniref:ileal sodium/bile acid cotransporter-like n=1 Tax=Megalops cyprinoides TaxID=118141 RepID=UPI001863D440|nr:ileal sodium/bile acid cotransporter-like [Megalops cyprinoides]